MRAAFHRDAQYIDIRHRQECLTLILGAVGAIEFWQPHHRPFQAFRPMNRHQPHATSAQRGAAGHGFVDPVLAAIAQALAESGQIQGAPGRVFFVSERHQVGKAPTRQRQSAIACREARIHRHGAYRHRWAFGSCSGRRSRDDLTQRCTVENAGGVTFKPLNQQRLVIGILGAPRAADGNREGVPVMRGERQAQDRLDVGDFLCVDQAFGKIGIAGNATRLKRARIRRHVGP